ncbi:MAG: hypothetical protein IT260_11665, partial [Saprospiraceae bacterium]|nr:hypothetical protein [Saprospiraceae bacterium]
MKITTQILLIAAFWMVVTTLFSQRQEALWYNKISMEEGLSSHDFIFFVHVDTEGFTWIGSTSGLNRFDGHQVKQYHANFQDSTALYGENIQSQFFEDSQHNLWFCTYEAVHCYVRKKDAFQHFFLRDSAGQQIREDYVVFQLEQDSLLWVRAGQSVFRVNVGNEQQRSKAFQTAQPVLHSEHFHAYAATGQDGAVQHVFLFSDEKRKGLEHFEIRQGAAAQKQVYFEQTQGGTPELGIFQVYFIDRDHIWLATPAGLMEWSLAHPAQSRLFPVAFKGYSYFAPYDNRHLIISFFGKGLYRFDQKTGIYSPYQLFPIKKSDQLRGPALRNIYLDRNQVLWVSVPFEGLIYANPAKRKFESIPNTLLSGESTLQFRNFTTDRQGQTWCSAATELFQFDPLGNLVRQIPLDAARSNKASINYVLFDNQNTLWMATSRGLYTSATPGKDIVCVPGTEDVDVLYLHQLDNLTLLATSLFGGIYEIKTGSGGYQVKNLYGEPGIGYTSMFRDELGHILICRNEAAIEVFRLQNGQLQSSATLPIPGAINAFWEDPDGRTL